jgi:hypothetical protein
VTQWGLDTLFNPAKRHMDEEKRRLQSTRAEVGDNSGGKRIDLESGKVRIRPSDDGDEGDDADSPVDAETAARAGRRSTGKRSQPKPPRGEPSAAAIRAAQRRGRQAR